MAGNKINLEKVFDYPYNFVFLGDEKNVIRKKIEKGNNSGKLKCTLSNKTPMFIGNKIDVKNKEEYSMTLDVDGKRRYVVPASTIKGELRNIIEVLTTSCIKNVEDQKLLPKKFHPCSKEELCFACRMFGSIGDSSEKESKKTEKTFSAQGRIFISDAISLKEKSQSLEERIILKSLGEPHPSLAKFYLEGGDKYNESAKIRGRKFYWHHTNKIKAGVGFKNYLGTISDAEKTNTNSIVHLLKLQSFEFEVSFKNLTDDELGVLIYALELENGMLHKFGKGKAFGLGSCKIEIKDCFLESSEKYNSFTNAYETFDKENYLKTAKETYNFDVNSNRREIKELKYIMSEKNRLDFSRESFPEEKKYKKKFDRYEGEENTLNWFINHKNENNFRLPHILDYMEKKK